MDFILRDAVESDLDQCLEIVTDRFLYADGELDRLRSMWLHIITSKSGMAGVIMDAVNVIRVMQFGTFVFVDDERARRYHALLEPGIARSIAREWASGEQPFLNRSQIARANAEGNLNLVVTHHGNVGMDAAAAEHLRAATYELDLMHFRGWNLKTYINELFTANAERDAKSMGEANGLRVRGYSSEQLRDAGIPLERAPWVWTATRDDVATGPIPMALGMLFRTFSRPRFGFAPNEQDVLQLALDGHTDETIAKLLNTSLTTTKKRFRTIYEKVQDASWGGEPLLGSEGLNGSVRGAEARRYLLKYLAQHPEELRPYASGAVNAVAQ